MNRIEYLDKINTYSARFVLEVEGFNAMNQYHINMHAENFIVPVLNEVLDLKLENLNATQRKNFPAIDLADFDNRVAVQVTATNDSSKVKDTIRRFFKHKLHEKFDVLYFYIITQKKEKYNAKTLTEGIENDFVFDANRHIIDKDDLLQKINSISSTPKIQKLSRLFEHEFSDVQIELRQKQYIGGYLNEEPEDISPNMLHITFSDTIYKADLDIDEEKVTADLNEYLASIDKKPIKKMKKRKLVKQALRKYGGRFGDWVLYENCIYTFKNLHDSKNIIRRIVDVGTITPIACNDFHESSEDKERVFKYLLRNTLTELCKERGIEPYGKKQILRFANKRQAPNKKKVRWKGKKESTKTVIFELFNKKEGHIICFRSLAFRSSFFNVSGQWFLLLNPTWSYTNPGGYDQSKYEATYMSGIKRLENNNAVFNYFRFFSYYLSYADLFTANYPHLKIGDYMSLKLSPSLEEKGWKAVKVAERSLDAPTTDAKEDTELFDDSLFD